MENHHQPPALLRRYKDMTKEEKMKLLQDRYNRLNESPKNWKCPGVVRKLKRQLRKAEVV